MNYREWNVNDKQVCLCEECTKQYYSDKRRLKASSELYCLVCLSIIKVNEKFSIVSINQETFETMKNTKTKRLILCKQCEIENKITSTEKNLLGETKTYICRSCECNTGYVEYVLPNKQADKLLNKKRKSKIETDKVKFRFIAE